MAQRDRSSLRKSDFLVIRDTRNDTILKITTPQNFQIGLDDAEFTRTLTVKGSVTATNLISGSIITGSHAFLSNVTGSNAIFTNVTGSDGRFYSLTGSLTQLSDGTSFLRQGSGVTISTGSDGSITISTSVGGGNSDKAAQYLVLAATGSLDSERVFTAGTAIGVTDAGAGGAYTVGLDIPNLTSVGVAPAGIDDLIIFDNTLGATKKVTINNLAAAVGGVGTLTNPLSFGQGLQTRQGSTLDYDNTKSLTVLIATASNGGLTFASDALTIDLDGSTLSLGASGISVASVPSALSQGTGISTFSFDGSSVTTVGIDTSVVPRLASTNTFSAGNTFSGDNTLSGDNAFSGDNTFSGDNAFTGTNTFGTILAKHDEVSSGVPYLVGGANTTISYNTPTSGQITIATSFSNLPNSLTQGSGIGSFTFDGSAAKTVALDASGLSQSGDRNSYSFLSDGSTTITKQTIGTLIDLVDRSAVMTPGSGISITYNGYANPASIAANVDGTTIAAGGSGLEVQKVPNALSQGTGIKTFSFDGSSTKTVVIDNSVVATLTGSQFSGNVGITGSLGVVAGITGSITKLPDGSSYLRQGNNISIISGANGSITISANAGAAGGGADASASYILMSGTGSLPNSRIFTEGLGLSKTDSSGNVTIAVRNDIVATLTGSTFTGNVIAQSGLTGSIQMLSDGATRYIVGTGGVKVSTSSNGQLVVSASSGKTYTAGTGLALANEQFSVNNSVVATLTGSIFTGNLIAQSGLSGSIQKLSDGTTPYIIGTGSIHVTTSSSGQLVLSSSGGGGGSSTVTQSGGSTFNQVTTFVFTGSTVADNGGGSVTIKPVIGAPEDGTYTDGLFTNFGYTTPIGTAVDKFNEVLLDLAPSPAPALDDINCNDSGTTAYLSFGASAAASGYTNVGSSAGFGTAADVNDSYTVATNGTNLRRGIFILTTEIHQPL